MTRAIKSARLATIVCCALAIASPGTPALAAKSKPFAPLPSNPLKLVRKAGLEPDVVEHFEYHVHAHLDLFVNGRRAVIPGGIGIRTEDPAIPGGKQGGAPAFGGPAPTGCGKPCISPLHTHFADGVIHIEALEHTPDFFTLGRFFREWNVRLDRSCVGKFCKGVKVYVDGERRTGNPGTIELVSHQEIAIVIGKPPRTIPSSYDFNPGD